MNNITYSIIAIVISIIVIGMVHISDVNRSVNDRLLLLEKQMVERVVPRIQINRATIYNTDGEIVVETLRR